jgi:hypothetical protein
MHKCIEIIANRNIKSPFLNPKKALQDDIAIAKRGNYI